MAWAYLVIAGISDVVWASILKRSNGFSQLPSSLAAIFFIVLSFFCLSLAIKQLPVSVAYTTLVGIGSVGTVIVGMGILGEPATIGRIACIVLIVSGIVGLKLQS